MSYTNANCIFITSPLTPERMEACIVTMRQKPSKIYKARRGTQVAYFPCYKDAQAQELAEAFKNWNRSWPSEKLGSWDRGEVVTLPEVGMGCSTGYGGDSYAWFVTEVSKNQMTATIQRAKCTPTDRHEGYYGNQEYTYELDPEGGTRTVKWTRKCHGFDHCEFGVARERMDPSF
tara:strand:- start:239 stop:763 length:525 start_codon:yes stop_codon:yes gene_type:complete